MTKEQLAKKIMAECQADGEPVTEQDALEMAEMELKAKHNNYTQSATAPAKEKKTRKPKKDLEKIALVNSIMQALSDLPLDNLQVINEQRELSFSYKGDEYALTIVKHRKPKA